MSRPTEEQMQRAVAALIPLVREWGLQLNPEHLHELADAVLQHHDTEESWDEIEAAVHAQIADFKHGQEAIQASYRRQLPPTD